ncbi:MAG: hypothetical protein ABSC51_08905 [Gaiellaceae bacterium]|jgi:hypothetical protein
MEFEIEWVDPSLVICRTFGVGTVESYRALMRALTSDPQFRPGIDVIIDHTKVDISALTAAEIEQIASLRVQFMGATARRAVGVVGPNSPMRYGLGRMFEAHVASQAGTKVELFKTLEEAMAWLRPDDAVVSPRTPSEDISTSR